VRPTCHFAVQWTAAMKHVVMADKENVQVDTNTGPVSSADRQPMTPKAAYAATAALLQAVGSSNPTSRYSSPLARLSITGKRMAALSVDRPAPPSSAAAAATTTNSLPESEEREREGKVLKVEGEVRRGHAADIGCESEDEPEVWAGDWLLQGDAVATSPVVAPRAAQVVEDVPTLLLERFQAAPVLDFGRVPCGKAVTQDLLIVNKQATERRVTVESFPCDQGFGLHWAEDGTVECESGESKVPMVAAVAGRFQFTVPAQESLLISVTWTPQG